MHRIAVVSDTHGLLRPEVSEVLRGAQLIIHAGDVGKEEVLGHLEALAPVRAIRGNVDKGSLLARLPEDDVVEVACHYLYLLHDRGQMNLDPSSKGSGFDVVITGHSHKPSEERPLILV